MAKVKGDLLVSGNVDANSIEYDRVGSYSTRYSETITGADVFGVLDQILKFTSVNPSVTLTITPSATREKGNTLSSIDLSGLTVRGQNPTVNITGVVFKRGSSTIETVASPIATGGTETFTENTDVTDTTTFSCEVTDANARTGTNSKTITFLYPLLYCVGAASLTPAQIYSAATKVLSATTQRDLSYTTSSQVFYYAYPATCTAITQVLDENNFDITADFTVRTENLTGLDGNPVSYKIWEFKNVTSTTTTIKYRN